MSHVSKKIWIALWVFVIAAGWMVWPSSGNTAAADKQTWELKDIVRYEGKDREQRLLQKAKEKGEILVYQSEQPAEFAAIATAFEKKYGIKVNSWKGTGEAVIQRTLTENSAGRLAVDVVNIGGIQLSILKKEGLLVSFKSPHLAKYDKATYDPDGYWAGYRLTVFAPMYNTKAVSPKEVPKSYKDLLDPRWEGRIAVEINDFDWYATLVKYWGPEGRKYFEQLRRLKLKPYDGHSLLTGLVTSGEIHLVLTAYLHHAIIEKHGKGAPVDWVDMEPTVVKPAGLGFLKSSKNPAGGMLFIDFALSEEGQSVLSPRGEVSSRIPALPSIPTTPPDLLKGKKIVRVDFDLMLNENEKWLKGWRDIIGMK